MKTKDGWQSFLTACEKSNDEASQLNLSDVREEIIICAIYDETAGSATIKAENRFNNSSEMGLCWSETSDNPTTSDIKKQVSKPAKKVFIERLDYLNPETTYYVRAYVIQKNIPQYSPVMFFVIYNLFKCYHITFVICLPCKHVRIF